MSKLTPRQEAFIKEYLVDLNGTQAAIRAGYKTIGAHVQASQLLSLPKVAKAIQEQMDKRAKKVDLTAENVLKGILRVIDRCEQAEPVLDREGLPTGEYTFQANAALKGYELLGKHLKLFTDKVEHSGTITLEALVAGSNRVEGQ